MTVLEFVKPGARSRTLNVLLYGAPKIGKTTAAISAPGPVLHLNAEGENAVAFARERFGDGHVHEVNVANAKTMNEVLLYLRGTPTEQTVVLDSVSAIFEVLLEEKANGGKPSLPMYLDVTKGIERWVREVRDIALNMVLICHETPIKDDSTGVIERLPFTGTSNPALAHKLMQWVDVIGYCGRASGDSGVRYMAQLVDAGGRRGGDRTDKLGTARELNLAEWVETAAKRGVREGVMAA